jgi:hypothetical protein
LRDRAALGAPLWPTGDADAQGYEEIEARAAYEHWVRSEGLRGRDDAERLGDVVKFHWEAVGQGRRGVRSRALLCSQSRKGVSASEAGSGRTDEFSVVCRSPLRVVRSK